MGYKLNKSNAGDFYGQVEVITWAEVILLLGEIEDDVSEALKFIEQIEGIESIDKCKSLLKEILTKL